MLQGLNLRRGEAAKALTSWGAALYGVTAILFFTPLLALTVQRLPLGRPELAFGLAVFCCMPTALSSGVTLTQASLMKFESILLKSASNGVDDRKVAGRFYWRLTTLSAGVIDSKSCATNTPVLAICMHALCPCRG